MAPVAALACAVLAAAVVALGLAAGRDEELGPALPTVPVTPSDILERAPVASTALARADILLFSGGLGPTEDDLTREAVAETQVFA